MSNLYTAEAVAAGGRAGHVKTTDGRLDLHLSVPSEIGGDGGQGTNPEQLFAAGYAACFQGALGVAARRQKVDADNSEVRAKVGLEKEGLGFKLNVELVVHIPGVELDVAQKLAEAAHQVCPYSNATRGNIDVKLSVI